jgi:hypothetical protein
MWPYFRLGIGNGKVGKLNKVIVFNEGARRKAHGARADGQGNQV